LGEPTPILGLPQTLSKRQNWRMNWRTPMARDAPPFATSASVRFFEGGHIASASFHGTASTAQGLADLKKWAGTLPRETNLVIYCGCCPFDHCPNIRPAFVALHGMGFTHLRVLVLPTNFASDWVDKSYPVQKGI
jgi:hypothetical protein